MTTKLSTTIIDLLKTIAKNANIDDCIIEINEGSSKGDGYLSQIVGVTLKSKSQFKDLDLILKIAPAFNEDFKNTTFQREIYVYEKLVPAFRNFAKEYKVSVLGSVGKCYGTISELGKECLVLENLKTLGYQLWQRQIPPSDDHIKLVFSEYAKLHALSFAMRSKRPKEFEELVKDIKKPGIENKGKDDPILNGFTKAFHKNAVKALESNKELLTAFEDYWTNRRLDFSCADEFEINEYSVVLHGDPWLNNVMFKYEDEQNLKKPTSLKLVDFQMSRLCPAVIDLCVFFCSSCNEDLLPNCQKYLDIYYNCLRSQLELFGLNVDELYPRAVFLNEWAKYRAFGLYASLMFIKLLVTEDDETEDLSNISSDERNDHLQKELKNQAVYNKRVYALINFMNENKWLN